MRGFLIYPEQQGNISGIMPKKALVNNKPEQRKWIWKSSRKTFRRTPAALQVNKGTFFAAKIISLDAQKRFRLFYRSLFFPI